MNLKKKKRGNKLGGEIRDFSGGPSSGVQSLVRELRSHMPCGKKKRESRSPIVYQLRYEGSPVTNSVKTLKKKKKWKIVKPDSYIFTAFKLSSVIFLLSSFTLWSFTHFWMTWGRNFSTELNNSVKYWKNISSAYAVHATKGTVTMHIQVQSALTSAPPTSISSQQGIKPWFAGFLGVNTPTIARFQATSMKKLNSAFVTN